jgi:putative methyltransferase (TIGR04325 family)
MKISDFIPPAFLRFWKDCFSPPRKFFLNYQDALDACSDSGYEDLDLVTAVFEKTRLIKDQMLKGELALPDATVQSLLAVLLSLRENKKRLAVVDFGGACGAHYFQLRPFLPSDVQLDWVVVETAAMVEKCRPFETKELRFYSSLIEAGKHLQGMDLIHSSGALQYVPDPEATLQEFLDHQPANIFLNRLVLSNEEMLIAIQESMLSANGPGALPEGFADRLCRYPVTYFPKRKLDEMLSKNYQMKFGLAETKMKMGEKELLVGAGMFLERH